MLNEERKCKSNQIPQLNLAESGQGITGKELDTQGFQRVQRELDKMSAKLDLMEAKVNVLEARWSDHQKSTPCVTVQQSADDVQSGEEHTLDMGCDQIDLTKEADSAVLKSLE